MMKLFYDYMVFWLLEMNSMSYNSELQRQYLEKIRDFLSNKSIYGQLSYEQRKLYINICWKISYIMFKKSTRTVLKVVCCECWFDMLYDCYNDCGDITKWICKKYNSIKPLKKPLYLSEDFKNWSENRANKNEKKVRELYKMFGPNKLYMSFFPDPFYEYKNIWVEGGIQ